MNNLYLGKETSGPKAKPIPSDTVPLTTPPKHFEPASHYLEVKLRNTLQITRHTVIHHVAGQNRS